MTWPPPATSTPPCCRSPSGCSARTTPTRWPPGTTSSSGERRPTGATRTAGRGSRGSPQPSRRSKSRAIAAWVLRVVVGLLFLLIAATKLIGTADTVDYFEAIGWGQWFRYLTGSLDLVGAVLLFVPRRTFYGAVVLISSVGTATVLSVTVLSLDPPTQLALIPD
ncbi:hypothetical protein DMB66_59225 [Actinoplanes sp. ATCC 53533]|nr:hypothetical protein DMB66_59225 [Actinoplanes sp. ATCC 53533]